jgi:uncharacterized protein (DUF2384 family)
MANNVLQAGKVAKFLDLEKPDVAKLSNVSLKSVRYDEKIPHQILDRMAEIANVCELVAGYFQGDALRTALWFKTKNPMLGQISPRDMIRFGRYERLRQFVTEALSENPALQG